MHDYVLPALSVSAACRFWSPHCPRANGVMMRVALVQVGDDLDVAPGVMRVGWVTAGWGAVEGYLQFDVKISSRQEGDLFGDNGTAPCACGTRSDSV